MTANDVSGHLAVSTTEASWYTIVSSGTAIIQWPAADVSTLAASIATWSEVWSATVLPLHTAVSIVMAEVTFWFAADPPVSTAWVVGWNVVAWAFVFMTVVLHSLASVTWLTASSLPSTSWDDDSLLVLAAFVAAVVPEGSAVVEWPAADLSWSTSWLVHAMTFAFILW